MALVKCRECGKEVSKKAKTCPHCGAASPAQGMRVGTVIISLIFLFLIFCGVFREDVTSASSPAKASIQAEKHKKAIEIAKKQEKARTALNDKAKSEIQVKRWGLIQGLVSKGVFQKVEMPGILPHVWVTPAFYMLRFNAKQDFIRVVHAYYISENRKSNIVLLYDSRTGKEIGKYASFYGGLILH